MEKTYYAVDVYVKDGKNKTRYENHDTTTPEETAMELALWARRVHPNGKITVRAYKETERNVVSYKLKNKAQLMEV